MLTNKLREKAHTVSSAGCGDDGVSLSSWGQRTEIGTDIGSSPAVSDAAAGSGAESSKANVNFLLVSLGGFLLSVVAVVVAVAAAVVV